MVPGSVFNYHDNKSTDKESPQNTRCVYDKQSNMHECAPHSDQCIIIV